MSSSSNITNISVGLSDEEIENLDVLVEFFQSQTISKVTRSDVMKYYINKNAEVLLKFRSDPSFAKEIAGFWEAMGIDIKFKV
jgi:hypothetical protein